VYMKKDIALHHYPNEAAPRSVPHQPTDNVTAPISASHQRRLVSSRPYLCWMPAYEGMTARDGVVAGDCHSERKRRISSNRMKSFASLRKTTRNAGFSLVELSIVLVILGLLVGGVLTGKSLIRAAELRAVGTEYNEYIMAIQSFRVKYQAIPGDMKNATRFWGRADGGADLTQNCAAPATDTDTGTPTCNGNGNGIIDPQFFPSNYSEHYRLWEHLAEAGLINGSYTGIAPATPWAATPGLDIPATRSGGVFLAWWWNYAHVSTSPIWPGNYEKIFLWSTPAGLTPSEAWGIDKKFDDASPAKGIVRTQYNNTTCSTTNVQATAEYHLQSTDPVCAFVFLDYY
jgi:prepilin-type N-terminal cleavage/methylation domain-containing protein